MNPFLNMRVNGQPSPADLAKAAATENVEHHSHGPLGNHSHGTPSFTPAEIAFLEQRGWHPDTVHGVVYDSKGGEVPPLVVGSALQQARRDGRLGAVSGDGDVAKCFSGPGEAAPLVQRLDLSGGWTSGQR